MSRSLSWKQAVLLGVVVVGGLSLLSAGVFAVGNRQWLWSDTFHVRVGFAQIRGVDVGTRVRVQGIEAGEVEWVEPPAEPGAPVHLRLRLDNRLRPLIRADATVQIVSEGMIGGKAIEIQPGSANAPPVADGSLLVSRPSIELPEVLGQVNRAIEEIRNGQGTASKFLKDPEAYARVLAVLQQSERTMASFQQDADALKRLPVLRNYVEDSQALLVRPRCERNRQWFAEADLFEPGRAVLTAAGRERLDQLAPWLAGLKHKGSEVVVATFADPATVPAELARGITREQSEAVCAYLTSHHAVQKLGWFASRKVTPLGMGTAPPPLPETEPLPPSRVEILVFVPQG